MIIIPAIDIRDGKCVRLYQGDFDKCSIMGLDPVEKAINFEKMGAEYLHLVDLDGALKGSPVNFNVIGEIISKVSIPVEVGGGLRTMDDIDMIIKLGAKRAILGTRALTDMSFLEEAVKKYGDAIALGLDAKDGMVCISGWKEKLKINYIEAAEMALNAGVKTIIFTDANRDGTLTGPNYEALINLNKYEGLKLIASGGIGEIKDLCELKNKGVYGAIIGKAIYSGDINLIDAIAVGR